MHLSNIFRQCKHFLLPAPREKVRKRDRRTRLAGLTRLEGRGAALGVLVVAVIAFMLGRPALAGAAPPARPAPSDPSPAAGASPGQAGGEKEEDDALDVVPLVHAHGWIRVEYAPGFRSGTPALTGECEVTGVGAIAAFDFLFESEALIGLGTQSTEGDFEQVCKTVDRTAPPLLTTCTIKKTWIVKAEVVDGKITGGRNPKRLEVISLKMQDYAKKTVTDCVVCTPQGCTPTHSEDAGEPSDWWPMALYRWPVADGHSETHGRFTYTLVLLDE
jgi:hypothetical protein